MKTRSAKILEKNRNKVPAKAWRRWSEPARRVFNRVYAMVLENQELITHPEQPLVGDTFWKTIAWNTAWLGADFCDGVLVKDVIKEILLNEDTLRKS